MISYKERAGLITVGFAASTQADLPTVDHPYRDETYQAALRVLTLTPFYPTASDDAEGCFIAEPLRAMHELGVNSCVVAVQPLHRMRAASNAGIPVATWIRYPSVPGGLGLASAGAFLYTRLISKIRNLHCSQRIDLIHAHAALPCGHAAMLLSQELRIPFVVTAHGLDVFFDKQVRGYAGAWCKRVAQSVYRSAARVICISHKVADKVADNAAPRTNTRVIYNSADAQMFSPSPDDFVPDTILSVGNLIPIKGHELLLRAVAAIIPEYPQISCEIIGNGPELLRLDRLASNCKIAGNVRFLGRQSRKQVADAMRRCVIFALPSQYEGLGCVYLEAMSAAKPVIACRGQGIDEIIQHGKSGWLIDPGNLQELIAALSALLQNTRLRRQMSEAARRIVLENHTSAHQATQLAAIYRECVA